MEKESLREKVLERRGLITDREGRSKRIGVILLSLEEFKKAGSVMFYVSKGSEVGTEEMIKKVLGEKRVLVPKVKGEGITACEIKDWKGLEKGAFGILEPKEVREASKREVDLILVPGIAFDRKGNRIGYGKGFYDSFLKEIKNKGIIGLAFEEQIIDTLPVGQGDEPVKRIVTENGVIDC
jgi:5-formyltetrahydrofolate cyclo-ligase